MVWYKIATSAFVHLKLTSIHKSLEKADHVMLDHKKLKKQNTELQEQNEKLQNDM
jgi:hypothetical protein